MIVPHRSTALITIIVFVALLLVILSSSPNSSPDAIGGAAKFVPRPKLPTWSNIYSPLRPSAHKPPERKNSSSGESAWFSDWKWLNPFSSSITLDENRSVLPPLRNRVPIYTYYDANNRNVRYERDADAKLLLAWRRAWYAQGFRPVILGRGEAMNNQVYEAVQKVNMSPELQADLFRWLAWGNMGSGLLADWRCFPMARYDDGLLSYLRRGAIPTHITRFERLDSCLFAGEEGKINDAIKDALKNVNEKSKSMLDVVSADFFKVESNPSALAYYSPAAVSTHYPALAEKAASEPAAVRTALVELINSHLHQTFQNVFPAGIAVLRPFPEYTAALVEPSLLLAKALVQCSNTPLPSSCPPNRPRCHPCGSGKKMHITQPSIYRNTSQLFTIGTLPHPYTLISLQQGSDDVTTRYIRRETARDPWLTKVTEELVRPEFGGSSRAVVFKDTVAGDAAIGSSLWMTVESLSANPGDTLPSTLLDEFEWQFGFKVPRDGPGVTKKEIDTKSKPPASTPIKEGVEKEYDLIAKARDVLKSKESSRIGVKDVAEAWNLADTEVWRFVRAYRFVLHPLVKTVLQGLLLIVGTMVRARSVVERKKWEEEEKNFVGV